VTRPSAKPTLATVSPRGPIETTRSDFSVFNSRQCRSTGTSGTASYFSSTLLRHQPPGHRASTSCYGRALATELIQVRNPTLGTTLPSMEKSTIKTLGDAVRTQFPIDDPTLPKELRRLIVQQMRAERERDRKRDQSSERMSCCRFHGHMV